MLFKSELRKIYLKYRLNIDHRYLAIQSKIIGIKLLDFIFENCLKNKIIAIYHPIKQETNLIDAYQILLTQNFQLCLPTIDQKINSLKFYKVTDFNNLGLGKYQIKESLSNIELIPDIIVIPLIACDLFGNRIGYGAGHYDRIIEKIKINKSTLVIAPCYNFQIIKYIPNESFDQKIDVIITAKKIFYT